MPISIDEIIKNAYSIENWRSLILTIFHNKFAAYANPETLPVTDNQIAKVAKCIGNVTTSDGYQLAVYDITLSDSVNLSRNRVAIRNLLRSHWKQFDGALIASHKENSNIWRFTFASETKEIDEQDNFLTVATEPKRYTYVLGGSVPHRTARDRFKALTEKLPPSIEDIKQAFSVEELTKEFYQELYKWYQWTLEPATAVRFPYRLRGKKEDREKLETNIIRLITRLMFVWFIKQKQLVPDEIFDESKLKDILKDFDPNSMTSGNYYNAILQNLFFATLNKAIVDEKDGKRRFATNKKADLTSLYRYEELFKISTDEVINMFESVPFLNGGLFECLDKDGTQDGAEEPIYDDGFSRNTSMLDDRHYTYRAFIPNAVFFDKQKGLFPLLNKYNFTVEENTPSDMQIALDPELLGKVFENLLGAYNPETNQSARNASGSFYTPREIVNFMVDKSLLSYLGNTDTAKSLFTEDFVKDESKESEYQEIARKLKAIKILDPACGSGAFPMGLLNRIVDILQKLEPTFHVLDLKREIIENCIYGCDIQPIAIQISKLRFFISLICDCEKSGKKEDNYNIPTLPNLETKFVAADSLIALEKQQAQGCLYDNQITEMKDELQQIRHKHFSARTAGEKNRLRDEDKLCRQKLIEFLDANGIYTQKNILQLAEWNPYNQNKEANFFDPEWMFGLKEGFDIVIGNPPYIQLEDNGGRLADIYKNCGYKSFARTGDIYCLFYERGQQLLKQNAHLCYITSNKWMRAGYGEKIRKFLAENTNPELLIDFAGVRIFTSATVDTNILLFKKAKNQGKTLSVLANKQSKECQNNLMAFVEKFGSLCNFTTSDSWVILSPIERAIKSKIEAVGTPLKDWDINIYRGVLTGYNDAFIISTEKRNEILNNCKTVDERKRTEELIRPILRGRDIKRYSYDWAELWLINTHNGIRGKMPRIDIAKYPAVKAHLDEYWERIKNRADQGDTPYNLRNCAYMEDFFKPKIVWTPVNSEYRFSFVKEGVFLNNSLFMVTGEALKYLCALFNSKLFIYYISVMLTGGCYAYGSKDSFNNLPAKRIGVVEQKQIEALVDKITDENYIQQQSAIDSWFYKLYNISIAEQNHIDKHLTASI